MRPPTSGVWDDGARVRAAVDQIVHQRVDALAARSSQERDRARGRSHRSDEPGPQRVVDVVVDVGDAIGQVDDLAFEGGRRPLPGMVADAVAHLPGEVETPAVVLQHLHHPGALLVVLEAAGAQSREHLVDDPLPGMAERGVPQVVPQGDGLGQVLVEPERPRDRAGDAGHLQRVRQPGAVVVALRGDEDLGLVLEPPERLAVHDAVAVALVGRAERARLLRALPASRGRRALRPLGEPRLVEVGGQSDSARPLVLHNVTGLAGFVGLATEPAAQSAPLSRPPCRPPSPPAPPARPPAGPAAPGTGCSSRS